MLIICVSPRSLEEGKGGEVLDSRRKGMSYRDFHFVYNLGFITLYGKVCYLSELQFYLLYNSDNVNFSRLL